MDEQPSVASVRRASAVLTREEIHELTRTSDAAGIRALATSWALVALALAACARWPHPIVIALAVVVVGGQQLALSVLMHEAAHRTLMRTRWLNDLAGDWLAGKPVWADLARYRAHHRGHHAHAGGEADPDRALIAPFPVTRGSLARKLARDAFGPSGLRRLVGLVLMDAEVLRYSVAGTAERLPRKPRRLGHLVALARNAGGTLVTNAALLGLLTATGHALLYLVWLGAYLTTFSLFLRIRSMAEHACTTDSTDPLLHTRTTRAGWLARLTVAPHQVHYHVEHHLLPTVPWFRLRALRAMLVERGVVAPERELPGYLGVLALVASRRPS
ncbi:MAG: fatty acid desaturase family protein [Deltaproteobacteria bacterium]|nr:fatty acid desaturase family protein [Deltaproteobacteria bacterium]